MKSAIFNKVLKLTIALCLICSSTTIAMANANENNDTNTIEYIKYDLETGERSEIIRHVELPRTGLVPSFGTGEVPISPYTIFDSSWTKVTSTSSFPYRAIASLDLYWYDSSGKQIDYQTGTGFAVAAGKVLTAAHCLYNLGQNNVDLYGTTPDKIVLRFGRNDSYVYKQTTATTFYVNSDWEDNQNANYDYGVITIPTSITAATGNFGTKTSADTTTPYTLSGYPYASGYFGKNLYTATGSLTQVNATTLHHKMNATGGVSGSPVYTSDWYAVGIHRGGNDNTNIATRITSTVTQFISGI